MNKEHEDLRVLCANPVTSQLTITRTQIPKIWANLGFSRPQDFFLILFKKIFPVFSDSRHPNVYISMKKNIRFIGTLNDQFIVKHGKFGDSVSIGHK